MTVKISDSIASILGRMMTNELESIWKKVVMASLWYIAIIYLERMGKITENKSVRVTDVLLVLNWAPPKYKCR